jgi:hypothetical protein
MTAPREHENLPELVQSYQPGSFPAGVALPGCGSRATDGRDVEEARRPSAALHGDRGLRGRPGSLLLANQAFDRRAPAADG